MKRAFAPANIPVPWGAPFHWQAGAREVSLSHLCLRKNQVIRSLWQVRGAVATSLGRIAPVPRSGYSRRMSDEPPADERPLVAWAIGAMALSAWFTMLWFMFRDVL